MAVHKVLPQKRWVFSLNFGDLSKLYQDFALPRVRKLSTDCVLA